MSEDMENLEQQAGDNQEHRWMPTWIVKLDENTKLGVTVDDGCYLVLVRDPERGWQPTKWIPKKVIAFISELDQPTSAPKTSGEKSCDGVPVHILPDGSLREKCCASSHTPADTACKEFLAGENGRCVYCDHEQKCHPGPGATCWVFKPESEEVYTEFHTCAACKATTMIKHEGAQTTTSVVRQPESGEGV